MDATQWRAWPPWLKRHAAKRLGAAAAVAAAALCGTAPGAMAAGEANAASLPATIGAKIHDATITTRAKAALIGKEDVSSGDIHVTTRHGDVLLTGSVPDEQQRMTAVNLVKQIDGVQHVRDQLTIRAK